MKKEAQIWEKSEREEHKRTDAGGVRSRALPPAPPQLALRELPREGDRVVEPH